MIAVSFSSVGGIGAKYFCGEILSLYGAAFWFIMLAVTACIFFSVYAVILLIVKENLFTELVGTMWNKIHVK